MGELLVLLGERLLAAMPGFLRRRIYPDSRLPNDVEIKLTGEKPVQINIGAKPAEIWINFEVENHSPVDITLDRITLFVWTSHSGSVAGGVMADRFAVRKHSNSGLVPWRGIITPDSADGVRSAASQPGARLTVNLTAYFDSPFGWFLKGPRQVARDVKDCV